VISSSSDTNWREGILSAFLEVTDLNYRSASGMCGARVTIDLCTWGSSRQYGLLLGRPGFYLLLKEENPAWAVPRWTREGRWALGSGEGTERPVLFSCCLTLLYCPSEN